MHELEPYYSWRDVYVASEDRLSPFYGNEYSEFEFSNAIYDYFIHPQWDPFGSATLYIKLLFAEYNSGYCIIELIGEWNDCLYNDIMYLKRNIADILIENGITKFIIIGENVFNFHAEDNDYYQEWFDDIEDGWIVFLNFREHILTEIENASIDYYIVTGGGLNNFTWRNLSPLKVFEKVDSFVMKRLIA